MPAAVIVILSISGTWIALIFGIAACRKRPGMRRKSQDPSYCGPERRGCKCEDGGCEDS